MSFPLQENADPFCEGRWDGQKYIPASPSEIIQCCLRSCQDHPNYCFNLCDQTYKADEHDRKTCYQQCNELASDCTDACYALPSEGVNIIGKCAEEKGCGKKPTFDVNCLKENKNSIVSCCQTECTGNQSLDCDGRCGVLYDLLVNGNVKIARDVPIHKESVSEFEVKERTFAWWLVIGVLIVVLVWVAWRV